MTIGKRLPRFRRASIVYRVEWKKQKAQLVKYEVQTGSVLSIVIKDSTGKEQIIVGRETLKQFSEQPDNAVLLEFERIAVEVVKTGKDLATSLEQSMQLAPLLGKKK